MSLKIWLESRVGTIADRWNQELRLSEGRQAGEDGGLIEEVARYLVSFLPPCFGETRVEGLEVWLHAAHLYGSLALRRGLAAGEVVEELQLLRGVILRLFLLDREAGSGRETGASSVRDMDFLALNRVLDQGVSRASVAYVDDLFFAHLQGSGVAGGVDEEVSEETIRQLESLRSELG
jgi:hypothetical protein